MDITHAKITKIAREVGRFVSQQLREDGVGPSEFDVIHAVRKHDGISQARICELLGRDKGAVARQVKSLCLRGYIVRRPSRSFSQHRRPSSSRKTSGPSRPPITRIYWRG